MNTIPPFPTILHECTICLCGHETLIAGLTLAELEHQRRVHSQLPCIPCQVSAMLERLKQRHLSIHVDAVLPKEWTKPL